MANDMDRMESQSGQGGKGKKEIHSGSKTREGTDVTKAMHESHGKSGGKKK